VQLRDYQSAAVEACWEYVSLHAGRNPCVALPTGAGKSLVIAKLAHDVVKQWHGRVIVLQHVKELIEQNADKLRKLSPDLDVGVYSAGLNRRDRKASVIVAGIQSVYEKAFHFDPFDVIIVDECHLLPPDGDGMYRQFLKDMKDAVPHCRLIGLTATPYRTSTGWLCSDDGLLNDVCYEIKVKELIAGGYLSKLISKAPIHLDRSGLHIRGGEFIQDEATALIAGIVEPACKDIIEKTADRNSVLVFAQSVEHCIQIHGILSESQPNRVEFVTGDTPANKRAKYLADFKAKRIKYLVNVNVLTTGFDAPNVDCVCLLRPTMSPGLYYQMVGRGLGLAEGKENCLVLDYAGNVRYHGPVDQIEPKPFKASDKGGDAPTKTCPQCESVIHAAIRVCSNCNHEFPTQEVKHDTQADSAPILSGQKTTTEFPVIDVRYYVHIKRSDPNGHKTLRVDYQVNPIRWFSEWVCVEHDGYAGTKSRAWWRARSWDKFPESAEHAKELSDNGALAIPESITVEEKAGEKFPRIVKVKLGEKPEAVEASGSLDAEFEFSPDSNNDQSWVDNLPW